MKRITQRSTATSLLTRYARQAGLIFVAVVIVVLGTSQTLPVAAATFSGSTLTTSPVTVNLSTSPGTTISTDLEVQNNGTKPVTISVKLEKFKAAGDNGQAQIFTPSASDQSISWVHFSTTSFLAEPGVWESVRMTVDVPTTAAFGYYYAVVFTPLTASVPIPGINTFRGANAVLVLMNVHSPGEKSQLDLTSFIADRTLYQFLPVTFEVATHNSGNLYSAPRGTIYVSRSKGSEVIATLDINPAQGNVLPGSSRVFNVAWNDGFPVYASKRVNGQVVSDSNGQPIQELQWDFSHISKLRFGQYYARLVFVYSDGSRDISRQAELTFWVIPWTLILAALVLAVLVVLGAWTLVRLVIGRPIRHIRLR